MNGPHPLTLFAVTLPEAMFDVTVEKVGTAVTVRVRGEIDRSTEQAFFDLLAQAFTVAQDVVVVDLAASVGTGPSIGPALDTAALVLRQRGMHLVVSHGPPGMG